MALSPRDFYLPQCLVVASPDGQQIFQEMLVADLLPDSLVVRLIERFGLPDEATIQCHRGVQSPAEGVVVEEGTLSVVNLLVEMNDTLCTVHEANKSATSKDEDVSSHLQTFLTLLLEFTASEPERQES